MTVVDTTRGADTPLGRALAAGDLAEMEVAFTDHQGHMCGKRIPAHRIARGAQVAFCSAALAWDYVGDVHDGTSLTGPDSGYPDAFLRPDPSTYRRLPWRPEAGHVISDVVDHHGELLPQAPRSVLRRAIERIAGLGYDIRMGLEIELYLLNADGAPASTGVHCYSLQKANDLDPAASAILLGLGDFVELEGGNVEYGPGQFEVNLANDEAGAGRAAAAEGHSRQAIAVLESNQDESLVLPVARLNYGNLCLDHARLEEADTLFARAWAGLDSTNAAMRGYCGDDLLGRARVRARQGHAAEAEALAATALGLRRGDLPENDADLRDTWLSMAEVSRLTGHPDQAAEMLARARRSGATQADVDRYPELLVSSR